MNLQLSKVMLLMEYGFVVAIEANRIALIVATCIGTVRKIDS